MKKYWATTELGKNGGKFILLLPGMGKATYKEISSHVWPSNVGHEFLNRERNDVSLLTILPKNIILKKMFWNLIVQEKLVVESFKNNSFQLICESVTRVQHWQKGKKIQRKFWNRKTDFDCHNFFSKFVDVETCLIFYVIQVILYALTYLMVLYIFIIFHSINNIVKWIFC